MRIASFQVVALCALLISASVGPAAAQDVILDGQYRGMGPASGAVLEIEPDAGGFAGMFSERGDAPREFLAERTGDIAETILAREGARVLMQIAPRPFGAEMVLIPLDPEGQFVPAEARVLAFLAPGLSEPRVPEGYARAPARGAAETITANRFLVSYPWWRPAGVARGYRALPERHRTLIRLFPAVQLDLIWKLCLAPDPGGALGTALRGQDVTCAEVTEGMKSAQRKGRYRAYRDEVAGAVAPLRRAVRCADGYVLPEDTCAQAADAVAAAATALATPGRILARYR